MIELIQQHWPQATAIIGVLAYVAYESRSTLLGWVPKFKPEPPPTPLSDREKQDSVRNHLLDAIDVIGTFHPDTDVDRDWCIGAIQVVLKELVGGADEIE